MRWVTAVFLISSISGTAAFAQCDSGEDRLKFALPDNETASSRLKAVDQLKEAFDKDLQGDFCVETVKNPEYRTTASVVKALADQNAHLAAPAYSDLAEQSPPHRVFNLPFAFRDIHSLSRYQGLQGPAMQLTLGRLQLHALGFWNMAMAQLSAKRSLINPTDAPGLKFRRDRELMSTPTIAALRATGVTIEDKDLATAIRDGRVEALAASWSGMDNSKVLEGHAAITETNHSVTGFHLVFSKPFWDKLDQSKRTKLTQSASRVTQAINREAARAEDASKKKLIRSGKPIRTLTTTQRQAWIRILGSVRESYLPKGGTALLDTIEKTNRQP